jgi:hypothetical protein
MLWGTPVSRSTLRLGEQLVLVVDGGTPDVEYALFDVGDIQLQATEPGTIREMGYTTFAGEARERLANLGVTQALADEAAAAARVPAAKYARGAAVRCIVADLGAAELFEGGTFEPASGHYTGTWLELPTLAGDLNMPEAAATMQALHLAALLAECPDDEPLVLSTAEVTMLRRPGERTHKRVSLGNVGHLARAIAELKPTSERQRSDKGPGRREILERLRARPHASQRSLDRVAAVEASLSALQAPTAGPLADPEIWNIELKLCRGDASHASAELDAIEQRRGRLPATAYLRARAALIARSEDPRSVAERVSALSTSMPTFHELELLAAEAWAAAGDTRRASAFARDVLENATAPDSVRIRAHEVLASGGSPSIRRSVPPAEPTTVTDPRSKRSPSVPPMPTAPRIPKATMPSRTEMGTASPPYRVEPLGERHWSAPPPRAVETEIVETLGMPPGAHGDQPPVANEPPRTPKEARITCTLLARELGRELRLRHGIELRSDLEGLETAQRYLRESAIDAQTRGLDERDVLRHGAFLGELLARRLGARWADLDAVDPRRWAMVVPSVSRPDELARIWPFARTARFVAMGHKERDLVSYYLEVEARSR